MACFRKQSHLLKTLSGPVLELVQILLAHDDKCHVERVVVLPVESQELLASINTLQKTIISKKRNTKVKNWEL